MTKNVHKPRSPCPFASCCLKSHHSIKERPKWKINAVIPIHIMIRNFKTYIEVRFNNFLDFFFFQNGDVFIRFASIMDLMHRFQLLLIERLWSYKQSYNIKPLRLYFMLDDSSFQRDNQQDIKFDSTWLYLCRKLRKITMGLSRNSPEQQYPQHLSNYLYGINYKIIYFYSQLFYYHRTCKSILIAEVGEPWNL